MKKVILIFGIAAAALAVSCNKEEAKVKGDDSLTGNKAYLVVNIHDAGSAAATRATSEADDFEYGTPTEYGVNDAYFYFYDDAGVFVSEAEVWDGGSANTATPDENIEFTSNTVIVLNNLTTNTYPNWVVTVLNKPVSFNPPENLDDFPSTLADAAAEGIDKEVSGTTYYTMSTTSYYDSANERDGHYFATELKEENFSLEPIAEDLSTITPVVIYVERLAVKVEVGVGTSLVKAATANVLDAIGGEVAYSDVDLYEIEATVAGDNNEAGTGYEAGDEKLYVGLFGWKLNATARHSNISKKINTAWTATDLGFEWTYPDYYRSYWGESFNYGINGAESADGNTDTDEADSEAWLNDYLQYTSLDGDLNEFGDDDYCAENTNNTTVLTSKYSSAITSVLVKAIVCQYDEDTETYYTANMVRYHGVLFEESRFLDYVLSELFATTDINAYYENGEDADGKTIYTHIDADFVKLDYVSDGKVDVVFNNEAGTNLYKVEGEGDDITVTLLTEDDYDAINEKLADFCGGANYDAIGYIGGLMYYTIPIEHLNNNYETDEDGKAIVKEGNYGVVRNHYYKLTINKIENVGKGIYDPSEVIVPNPDDEEVYYYVGAEIHILSWHVVEQDVTL